jgi:hypothetical protein
MGELRFVTPLVKTFAELHFPAAEALKPLAGSRIIAHGSNSSNIQQLGTSVSLPAQTRLARQEQAAPAMPSLE